MAGSHITLNATHYEAARDLAARGVSRAMIAESFNISVTSFHRLVERDGALRAALDRGDAADILEITNVYREKTLAGSYQHGDRYLFLQHAIRSQGEAASPAGGVTIHVSLPFSTGREGWSSVIDGAMDAETVDSVASVTHEEGDA